MDKQAWSRQAIVAAAAVVLAAAVPLAMKAHKPIPSVTASAPAIKS